MSETDGYVGLAILVASRRPGHFALKEAHPCRPTWFCDYPARSGVALCVAQPASQRKKKTVSLKRRKTNPIEGEAEPRSESGHRMMSGRSHAEILNSAVAGCSTWLRALFQQVVRTWRVRQARGGSTLSPSLFFTWRSEGWLELCSEALLHVKQSEKPFAQFLAILEFGDWPQSIDFGGVANWIRCRGKVSRSQAALLCLVVRQARL